MYNLIITPGLSSVNDRSQPIGDEFLNSPIAEAPFLCGWSGSYPSWVAKT